jgi:exosortase
MVRRWSQDPQYTHGYVVPIFALLVLWFRREHFPKDQVGPCWWGLLLIVLGGCARMVGTIFSFDWLDGGSLLPSLVGVVLLCLGPAILLWSWPAFVLLLFVLPWPYQFDEMLTFPLRRIATDWSTFALQTLGVPALARGNVITIDKLEVGVVEACSGLGMLMTFFALSTAIAFVIRRPLADKIIIFLSAIPVGVLMNVVRITITVFLYRVASAEVAQVVFHDVAGWVMMPMAVGVMWLELCWLRRLWLTEEETGPVRVSNWENEFMASGGLPSPVTADPQEVHASRAPSLAESNYPLTAAPVNSGESL